MLQPSIQALEAYEERKEQIWDLVSDFSRDKAFRDKLFDNISYISEQLAPFELKAMCRGLTGVYNLRLYIIKKDDIGMECSCPAYAPWIPCKHLAAFLLNLDALAEDQLEPEPWDEEEWQKQIEEWDKYEKWEEHIEDREDHDTEEYNDEPAIQTSTLVAQAKQKQWAASLRTLHNPPDTSDTPDTPDTLDTPNTPQAADESDADERRPSKEATPPPTELYFEIGHGTREEAGFILKIWGGAPAPDHERGIRMRFYHSIAEFLNEDCRISDEERRLLLRLQRLETPRKNHRGPEIATKIKIHGAAWHSLLPKLVNTGKVLDFNKYPKGGFSWGHAKQVRCAWRNDENLFYPDLEPDVGLLIDCGERIAWLDMDAGKVGWLEPDRPLEDLFLWLSGPKLNPIQLAFTVPVLKAAGLPPPPDTVRIEHLPDAPPTPVLVLAKARLESAYFNHLSRTIAIPHVRYHDILVEISEWEPDHQEPVATQRMTKDGRVIQIANRNARAEQRVHDQLNTTCLTRVSPTMREYRSGASLNKWSGSYLFTRPNFYEDKTRINWQKFHEKDLPDLLAEGWEVHYEDELESPLINPPAEHWTATLTAATAADSDDFEHESSGIDWFSLTLGVEVDGQWLDMVDVLQSLLADKKAKGHTLTPDKHGRILVRLEDGRALLIPERVANLAMRLVFDLFNSPGKRNQDDFGIIPLAPLQAASLLEADPELIQAGRGTKALKKLAAQLRNFSGIKQVPPPKKLNAELRSYQQEGLSWLQFLRGTGLHGILADDMGLGKTVQTIAHLLKEKAGRRAKGPSLVVAPTSVLHNWFRETQRFAPTLRGLIHHGLQRDKNPATLKAHDLVITSYALLNRDRELLTGIDWHLTVLDEAQAIKNPKAKVSEAARELRAKHRLCLSGTPFENHLGELWSLFDFLIPGYLGDSSSFRRLFRTPIEKHENRERQKILADRVRPLLLRRRKEDVALDLPDKSHIEHTIELHPDQQTLYETVRAVMDEKVRDAIAERGLARSSIIVLDALLKLRQICCHPALLKNQTGKRVTKSAKLERLMEILPKLVEEGRRILLFSQFTSMLELIEAELEQADIHYIKLTGRSRKRPELVEQFQTGNIPVFLISLKAGGTGLNLTAADTVIHYDPWWNPAVEAQATDRAHRIGQDKPVFVHRLICRASIEQHIQQLQAKKQGLVDAVLSGDTAKLRLNQSDIDHLLQPITAAVDDRRPEEN